MAAHEYLYELRDGDEIVVTGHMTRELPLDVGDEVEIAGRAGVVLSVEPTLRGRELRLVLQLGRS